jgi:DNA invertase Pin-like site-specific DNA recombinase
MRGKFISYLRVSTDKQGERGYGLDAQRKAINDYLNGGSWELLGEFVEVESGKRNDRPKLAEALAACKRQRARLIIAKLDRLSRNVAFIATLMDGKVDFICCDFPQANRLTLHVLAAVAEHEREMISERTRAGLAAARERGVKLGGPRLPVMNEARLADAVARAQAIAPLLAELAGMSARAIAAELNKRRVETPTGAPWSAKTVIRARQRLTAAGAG